MGHLFMDCMRACIYIVQTEISYLGCVVCFVCLSIMLSEGGKTDPTFLPCNFAGVSCDDIPSKHGLVSRKLMGELRMKKAYALKKSKRNFYYMGGLAWQHLKYHCQAILVGACTYSMHPDVSSGILRMNDREQLQDSNPTNIQRTVSSLL